MQVSAATFARFTALALIRKARKSRDCSADGRRKSFPFWTTTIHIYAFTSSARTPLHIGLGGERKVSLAKARVDAALVCSQVEAGIDPVAERKKAAGI